MDENQYRQTCQQVNAQPCLFERAVLRGCATCHYTRPLNIAEREAVGCLSAPGHSRCRDFLATMHDRSLFAVKPNNPDGPLPFGKEIKIQCGSLLGLRSAMGTSAPIDVHALLEAALARYHAIEQLPFEVIVREVTAFQPRRRTRG